MIKKTKNKKAEDKLHKIKKQKELDV